MSDDIAPGETAGEYDKADQILDMLIRDARKLGAISTPDLAELIFHCVDHALGGHSADDAPHAHMGLTTAVLATAVRRLAGLPPEQAK